MYYVHIHYFMHDPQCVAKCLRYNQNLSHVIGVERINKQHGFNYCEEIQLRK